MKNHNIYVSLPDLPEYSEYLKYLSKIWDSRILTNNGPIHQEFENKLKNFLRIDNLSIYSNATIALLAGLKVLEIQGEIITTPFSFVATSHAIMWNNLTPVFADITPNTGNLNPYAVEKMITEKTSAIMPVHVYGNPCDLSGFEKLAVKYNLKLIYDAAHCFDVKSGTKSVLNEGDLSIISFHATKAFNTIEGGAIVSKNPNLIEKLNLLKNFGFKNEVEIDGYGINGKMNEFQAAFGILQLDKYSIYNEKRKSNYEKYESILSNKKGISLIHFNPEYTSNYSYMPIILTKEYGSTRDELYLKLKDVGIHSRRYFFPLISNLEAYNKFPSSNKTNLLNANYLADNVLCLPMYADLDFETIEHICSHI
ncbi:MAG: DegT/DnrJ/EryC1/StrS family aminotransferase [Crocinitomicaceae bacterium]|jgi:dTDP-4-amino-4,6-dideoxygalactose transaminase|nr:DegT/DnrJ/EryC1/StrS family aminotransferase [Crocinitomicaceae bacterium]